MLHIAVIGFPQLCIYIIEEKKLRTCLLSMIIVKVASARQAMMGLRQEEIEKQEPYVQMLIRFEMPFT